jgi:cyclohexanone monooxygenase
LRQQFRHPSGKVVRQLPFSGKEFAARARNAVVEDFHLR